jgi:hypothetical protein
LALWCRLHPEQHVREVGLRVYAVGLAGGDERVQACDVVAGLVIADEEVILSPERGCPERRRASGIVRKLCATGKRVGELSHRLVCAFLRLGTFLGVCPQPRENASECGI